MSYGTDLPDDVMEAVGVIRELGKKSYLARAERDNLNRAKLRIAFWACRSENIVATRENLAYVLGTDAAEIMGAYDKYLERADDQDAGLDKRGGKDGGLFWKNA